MLIFHIWLCHYVSETGYGVIQQCHLILKQAVGGNYSGGTAEIEAGAAAYWRWQTLQLVSHISVFVSYLCAQR